MFSPANSFRVLLSVLFPESDRMKRLARLSPELLAKKYQPTAFQNDSLVTTLFSYKDPVIKDVLWALKYERQASLAEFFGDVLHSHLLELLHDEVLFQKMHEKPCLVPIPMTHKKRKVRGYNQVELLIAAVVHRDRQEHFTYSFDVLAKRFDRESQARTKHKKERTANVRGTFAVRSDATLHNQDIFLIDDIITTGATIREARQTLLEAGAKSVTVVALAH